MDRGEHIKCLKNQYPFMKNCVFELPTGWQLFTKKLCAAIASAYKQAGLAVDFRADQIVIDDDNNYVLSYRFTSSDEQYVHVHRQVEEIVQVYVRKSSKACIMCGEPGSFHKAPNGNYAIYWWICVTPFCEACWQEALKKWKELEEYADQHPEKPEGLHEDIRNE